MRTYRLVLAALVLGWIASTSTIEAQQGGAAIRGRVTDEQNAVLPGVAIVLTHAENGTVRETVSGADGTYLVPGIVPGPYRVNASLQGFSRLTQRLGTFLVQTSLAGGGFPRQFQVGARLGF